jgi:hypothetical protein
MTFYRRIRSYPTIRARGFAGSPIWRRKGEYIPTGRRRIPVAEASRLWLAGKTMREILDTIGPVKGSKFTLGALFVVIHRERTRGNPALFPIRRSADDGEPDLGIDEHTQRALGI